MGSILRSLFITHALARGADGIKLTLRRAIQRGVLALIGLGLALVGCGFILAAAYIKLSALLDPISACLIIGGTFLVVGAAFLLALRGGGRKQTSRFEDASPIMTTMLDLGQDLGAAASRNPAPLLAAAFVAGLFLGRSRR
jgi:hypothetical protein